MPWWAAATRSGKTSAMARMTVSTTVGIMLPDEPSAASCPAEMKVPSGITMSKARKSPSFTGWSEEKRYFTATLAAATAPPLRPALSGPGRWGETSEKSTVSWSPNFFTVMWIGTVLSRSMPSLSKKELAL